jgi:hypothetical protein
LRLGAEGKPARALTFPLGGSGASGRLEAWRREPRSGGTSELAGEALHALKMAPVEGSNGYGHKAEDTPEALARRHGASHGDDISEG